MAEIKEQFQELTSNVEHKVNMVQTELDRTMETKLQDASDSNLHKSSMQQSDSNLCKSSLQPPKCSSLEQHNGNSSSNSTWNSLLIKYMARVDCLIKHQASAAVTKISYSELTWPPIAIDCANDMNFGDHIDKFFALLWHSQIKTTIYK